MSAKVERPFVVAVESNVKGGIMCALGPRTLIVGPTGSAKSAVTNAVELALTGRVSDVRGREDVAQPAIIMSLAPERSGRVFAKVKLSNGAEASWETTSSSRGSAKAATHLLPPTIDPRTVLPLRVVKDAIVADADKARRTFLGWIAGEIKPSDVAALIPAPLLPRYNSLLARCDPHASPVDQLLQVTEDARREAREAGARAKAGAKVVEAAGMAMAGPPTEAEIAAAVEAVAAAQRGLEAATRRQTNIEATIRGQHGRAMMEAELMKQTTAVEALNLKRAAAQRDLDAALAQAGAAKGEAIPLGPVQQAIVALRAAQAGGLFGDDCACCLSKVGIAKHVELNAQAQALVRQRTEAAQRLRSIELAVGQLRTTLAAIDADLKLAASSRDMLQSTLANYVVASPQAIEPALDIEAARAAVTKAQTDHQALIARRASWDSTLRARDGIAIEEQVHNEWKQLEGACDKAVEQLLDAHVAGVAARVQARLPPNLKFGLQLRDGARSVFEIGFLRDGVLHSALSGGEWAQMTLALADAFAPPTGPSVIIPFDRQMDPVTLAAALEACSQSDSQIIVTTVVRPTRIPAGWTVIDTERQEHRQFVSNPAAAMAASLTTYAAAAKVTPAPAPASPAAPVPAPAAAPTDAPLFPPPGWIKATDLVAALAPDGAGWIKTPGARLVITDVPADHPAGQPPLPQLTVTEALAKPKRSRKKKGEVAVVTFAPPTPQKPQVPEVEAAVPSAMIYDPPPPPESPGMLPYDPSLPTL